MDVSQLSYWWRLAGGSPYRAAAERLLLRPTPPILRASADAGVAVWKSPRNEEMEWEKRK